MTLESFDITCPLCDTTVIVPATTTTSPVHAVDEIRMLLHADMTEWEAHLATHTPPPGPGLPVRNAA